jgi:hypothetical protein
MRRAAEFFSWFGLFGAALAWTFQLVVGFGTTLAGCSVAGRVWGVDIDAWQIGLMIGGGIVVLLAEAAAIYVFVETSELRHEDPPPWGRRHFFASAAMLGNVLFLGAILLSGLGAIYLQGCTGA